MPFASLVEPMSRERGEDSAAGIQHPHDSFNRKWFGDPVVAADVLRVVVPDSLKPWIDPERLHLEPVSFIDKNLRPNQSDLLWSCRGKTGDGEGADTVMAYFYVLWEHQSRVDPWMVLRLFCYMARIWERWLLDQGQDRAGESGGSKDSSGGESETGGQAQEGLPLIFPLVLYQGRPVWTAAQFLGEMVGNLPDDLRPFFPDFRFHLETLETRPDTDFPPGLAQLGISVLKLMWDEDFIGWLGRFGPQLLELNRQGPRDELELLLVYAFTQVHRSRREEFIAYIHQNLSAMETTGESIYDSLIEEGLEQGLEQGLEKDRAEKDEALRAMVRNMLDNGKRPDEILRLTGLERPDYDRLMGNPGA